MKIRAAIVSILAFGFASLASADIVYNVNQRIGDGLLTGSFTTNGHLGTLHDSDIISFSLTGTSPNFPANDPPVTFDGFFFIVGDNLTATATDLLYDFSAPGNNAILFFSSNNSHILCYQTNGCDDSPGGEIMWAYSIFDNSGHNTVGVADRMALSGVQSIAHVDSANTVPEPASLLLTGVAGLALAVSRRRRRSPASCR